jgi:hypothetical protein
VSATKFERMRVWDWKVGECLRTIDQPAEGAIVLRGALIVLSFGALTAWSVGSSPSRDEWLETEYYHVE